MKKIIKLNLLIFLGFLFFLIFPGSVNAQNLSNCLTIKGKFTATNWTGGSVTVSCQGDSGPSGCTGESQTVQPGGSYELKKCSCPPYADGCLKVQGTPNACSLSDISKYCGTNKNKITGDFQISCPAPTPSSPPGVCTPGDTRTDPNCRVCDPNGQWQKDYSVGDWLTCKCKDSPNAPECQPTPTQPSGVCTPGDTRTEPNCRKCDSNGQWQKDYSVGDWQACFCKDNPDDPSCKPIGGDPDPTPTSTPGTTPGTTPGSSPPPGTTPGPACNKSCGPGNIDVCTQATDGCTACNLTTGKCVPPTTPPGGGASPTPISTPTNTPTPTPDFNPAMCKCDGFNVSAIIAGQKAKFTAFGKVEGEDTTKARIDSMKFKFMETDKGASTGKKLAESDDIAAKIVEESPNKVRYQTDWELQIPSTVDANKSYRVWAELDCQRKTNANAGGSTASVLSAEDEATPSFFGKIINFFKSLFGQDTEVSPEPIPATEQDEDAAIQQQLRLDTVRPGNVTLKACNMVFFEFPSLSNE